MSCCAAAEIMCLQSDEPVKLLQNCVYTMSGKYIALHYITLHRKMCTAFKANREIMFLQSNEPLQPLQNRVH